MRGGPRLQDHRGVALAVAIFALATMAALVAGSFLAGRLEHQSGRNTLFAGQTAEAAEAGLAEALGAMTSSTLAELPVGGVLQLDSMGFAAGFRLERRVSRLTSTLFLLRSLAARQDAGGADLAVRTVGLLLVLLPGSAGGLPTVAPLSQRSWVQLY